MAQVKDDKYRRKHQLSFLLNELELKAVNKYCRKYRVKNRSKFIRECIITLILKRFEDDYPKLFEVPVQEKSKLPRQTALVFPD